jgi:hypothetical protein
MAWAQDEDAGGGDDSDTGYSGEANLHVGFNGAFTLNQLTVDYAAGTDWRQGYNLGVLRDILRSKVC